MDNLQVQVHTSSTSMNNYNFVQINIFKVKFLVQLTNILEVQFVGICTIIDLDLEQIHIKWERRLSRIWNPLLFYKQGGINNI